MRRPSLLAAWAGWISFALLPFGVVDLLDLTCAEGAWARRSAYLLVLNVMIPIAGRVMDRVGMMRVTVWGFALMTLYPLGLLCCDGVHMLTAVTLFYAVAMSIIRVAGTVGPITLAPHTSSAPHCLAIHATLVGRQAIPARGRPWSITTGPGV